MAIRWICLMLLFVSTFISSFQDQCDLNFGTLSCDGSKSNITAFPNLNVPGMSTSLRIVNTNLTDLQSGIIILPKFNHMVSLDLSFNGIRILNSSLLENNPVIEIFKLVGNKLRSIPTDVLERTLSLKYIDFSHNFIETIEGFSFRSNKYLEYISVRNNRVHSVRKYAFFGLESIKYIHLSDNNIDEFPFRESGYNFTHLSSINLQSNSISRLTATDDRYPSCQTLRLQQNFLRSLDEFALAGFLISNLYLGDNFISRIETYMLGKSPHNLTSLTLPNNVFTVIPVSFLRQLARLRFLNLANNRLTNIPADAFINNSYLQTISLQDNSIHLVHALALIGLQNLKTLDLRHNNLTTLPAELFDPTKDFQIRLSGNSWTCGCEVYPMQEWLKKSEYFVDDIECGITMHESTTFLLEIPFEEICFRTEADHVTSLTTEQPHTKMIGANETKSADGGQAGVTVTSFLVPIVLLFILISI